MHPNFPNQMNANFPNQGNTGFFNQPPQNFGNQNFGHRYPSQRFQRPFNNYGNNNNNVSEVTRHARKMHGMARRMLAVAQAMFKNPEEFTENPENINIYNFSNRFRNPNDQRPWRQNSNDNYRNNYRPRFENNFKNFNSNFGQNSFNSSFGQNFNPNMNNFNNTNSQNQENQFYQAGDRNDSSRSRNDENNADRDESFRSRNFGNNSNRDDSFRPRNAENNANCFENSDSAPETKFNPNATTSNAASRDSNPSPGERDGLFFVDVAGENPSNLLHKARTIPGCKPSISFADKKPVISSSSSESSESESDNDGIEVIQPAKKKPEIEMIDILSSDEDICTRISSKVDHSKQTADTICSKLHKSLKTRNPEIIDIGGFSKKRRVDSIAQVITLDDDVTVIDCEPVQSVARSESDSSSEDSNSSTNLESEVAPKESSPSEPPVVVKREEGGITIKTENSTGEPPEVASDNSNQIIETTSENTTLAITVKRESTENHIEAGGETRNEIDTLNNVTIKSEREVENLGKTLESSASEFDRDSESDNESNQVPADESAPGDVAVNVEQHLEEPNLNEIVETSSSTVGESSVIEQDAQSDAGVTPKSGWAGLKAAEKEKLPDVSEEITQEKSNVDKPSAMEVDNMETKPCEAPSSLSEENKSQALLQPHHCKNLGTVLDALQIFKPPINEPKNLPSLKVSFDVYQPKKDFGKASRPDPDYRIIVTGYMDPVPSPVQIDEIKNRYHDNIKTLFAVVHPSSISFFFIGNVQLPVQIDDLLF